VVASLTTVEREAVYIERRVHTWHRSSEPSRHLEIILGIGPVPLAWLALIYADMGRMEQARTAAQKALKLKRKFSSKGFVNGSMDYKDRAKSKRALATLRQPARAA